MTSFGDTLMTEQSGPKDLVRHAQKAGENLDEHVFGGG